jgi:glyceraldehyde 3-phosphate dehydrogenase
VSSSRITLGINGLGRIGRCVIRALAEGVQNEGNWPELAITAVNGPAAIETHLHLLRYDSVHGRFRGEVKAARDGIDAGLGAMRLMRERDVALLDWRDADIVLECSGKFTKREEAAKHLERGAKRVLISAPSPDADVTIVEGVNHPMLRPEHKVISVGSCTTNCLAPVAKVLNDAFGIRRGFMTTIHSYTGDQNLVDGSHKDLRRARAAALAMVPTSTGAAKTIGAVLPELQGKLDGVAIRVPTPNVSMIDLTFESERPASREAINAAFAQAASEGPLKGILAVCDEPLVSIDFTHHSASAIVDLTGTKVVDGRFCRVSAWYDNEWGFSCRMLDVAKRLGGMG